MSKPTAKHAWLPENQPLSGIRWADPENLHANDYNPNVVISKELRLLELSLTLQGWIQPILCTKGGTIIDGFHRWTIAKKLKVKVPVVILDLTEPERMLLTIRINRAKGSHVALKMADIVKTLVEVHGYSLDDIGQGIGATKDEVELLLQRDVFEKLDVSSTPYSQAWEPE